MLVIDTVIRHVPGVLGDETSCKYDSFADAGLLEHPQYTRPREFRGMEVPPVLLSGNHEAISRWQAEQSLRRTEEVRGPVPNPSVPPSLKSSSTFNGPCCGKG